ncbi:MAG: NCS2 family permease, partial [Deltaproteobacteria bacterium]|nr:NCS2 family permease [Deltaproteobacteria bacterium]
MFKVNRLISSGDIDGFFGLAVDNLIQFLVILALCTSVLGFDSSLVIGKILPGAALSIFAGNIFYALQAKKLGLLEKRDDVTALPYGINTVSLFAFVFLVMLPVKIAAASKGLSPQEASLAAWQTGLAACFLSGVIELAGSFAGDKIRALTPRAALLSTLAGIAISFISIDFAMRTFQVPLVALLPLGVILVTYFAKLRLPFNFPGGLAAVILGSLAAWILTLSDGYTTPVNASMIAPGLKSVGFYLPVPVVGDLVKGLISPLTLQFLVPVILPMGLFNVLGSLQNIESADAAGDSFKVKPSLIVNGAGSIAASIFGSVFPTTIYIGHPGWKALGAKSGYSILNGIFFIIVSLFGLTGVI